MKVELIKLASFSLRVFVVSAAIVAVIRLIPQQVWLVFGYSMGH